MTARAASATGQRRRGRGAERYYVGRRPFQTEVYVVASDDVRPLEHLGYRSDAPFDWSGLTPGALELAIALLSDATNSQPTEAICQAFRADVVARLEHSGFILSDGDIALWLLTAFPGEGYPRPAEPRLIASLRRAARRLRPKLRRR